MSGLLRAVAFAALTVTAALAATGPARAATQVDVFIQVNPNTIQAGFQVGIRASCGDDLNPATVRSPAFGEITLVPHYESLLTGSATVPTSTRAGEYKVDLRCANGATATAELFVLDMARPTRGPDTGGGGTAHTAAGAGATRTSAAAALVTLIGLGAVVGGLGWYARHRRS